MDETKTPQTLSEFSKVPETDGQPFLSTPLSNVLERTHEAAGKIVDFDSVRAQEIGIRSLFRAGNVLQWFRGGATEEEVAGYAAIIDAMNEGRRRLNEAANDPSSLEKSA